MKLKKLLYTGLLLSGLAGVSVGALAADIEITDPVARAVPEVMVNSAAFFTMKNTGNKPVTLVSVDSSVAGRVELHGHKMEGDMMRMFKREDGILVPAGGEAKLQTGGDHVMLMGLKQPLKAGDTIAITLHFSDGDAMDLEVPVKDMRGQKKDMAHGNMKH